MLSDAELALIAREVKSRTGQALAREQEASIEARLMPLIRRDNHASLSDLIAAARANLALWTPIADALAAPETRFFRDRTLFKLLRAELVPALIARRGGARLQVWSAGCSTGQEAYSLAILMEELRNEGRGAGADVVGTDASERLIEKARSGLYTQFEVQRGLPIRTLIAHFEKVAELWRVHDRLRANIRFERQNLLEDSAGRGPFDLVLCCHVLSGMTTSARAIALETLAIALAPDGILAIGAGEAIEAGDALTQIAPGLFRRNGAWRKAA